MAWDGAGSLMALGIRVTKLGPTGAPLVGAQNCYKTTSLTKMELGLTYEETDVVTSLNGQGVACVSYQAPQTLREGAISGLVICEPDPILTQFLIGGDYISDTATPTPNQIGYRAPQTGVPINPNGVSIEVWSRAISGSAYAANLPFVHWVVPFAQLTPSGTWQIAGTDATAPEFQGVSRQNAGWLTGPAKDFTYPSDRVWQYVREATLPDLSRGFVAVT